MTNAVSARIASFGCGRRSSSSEPSRSVIDSREVRLHANAVIRERGVGAGDFDQRHFLRAERHRQERPEVLREAELLRIRRDLRRAEHVDDLHRRNVARLLERAPQRQRAHELAIVVARRVRRLAGAGVERRRLVDQDRRRREAAIDRRGVEDRLDRRAHLAIRLRRAIELAAREAVAADHRQHLAGVVVDRDQRAFEQRRLLERAPSRSLPSIVRELDFDQIAGLEDVLGRLLVGPLHAGARQLGAELADAQRARSCR